MGISEELFEEFFKELENDRDFPSVIREELKETMQNNKITSEEIINIIKKGDSDVHKD